MARENDVVAGVALLTNSSSTRLKPQVEEKLYRIGQDQEMFYTFLKYGTTGGDRSAKRLEIIKQKQQPYRTRAAATSTTGAGAVDAAATLVLDLYTHLVAGDVVQNLTTGDQFRVTTTPSSTSVATTRWSALSTTAVAVGEVFEIVGYIAVENQAFAAARSRNTDQHTVYLQEFHETISMSKWLQMSQMYGPKEADRQIENQIIEFKRRKNRALLYGMPGSTTLSSAQAYGTAGAFYYGDRYNPYFCHSGNLTLDDLGEHLSSMQRFTGTGDWALLMGYSNFVKMGSAFNRSGNTRYDQKETGVKAILKEITIQGINMTLMADYSIDAVSPDKILIAHKQSIGMNSMSGQETIKRGQEIIGERRDTITLIEICGFDVATQEVLGSISNVKSFTL